MKRSGPSPVTFVRELVAKGEGRVRVLGRSPSHRPIYEKIENEYTNEKKKKKNEKNEKKKKKKKTPYKAGIAKTET